MKIRKYTYCILFAAFVMISLTSCKTKTVTKTKYVIGKTFIFSGEIRSGTYLSRSDNSDKEYFNTSYNLYLDKPIQVVDPNKKYIHATVTHIEIQNPNEYDITTYTKVKIRGILKIFQIQSGFYRQYSTPIQIEILEIISE